MGLWKYGRIVLYYWINKINTRLIRKYFASKIKYVEYLLSYARY